MSAIALLAGTAGASVESELAFHRGVVAYGEGRLEEARNAFEAAVAADPDEAAALRYLALIAQAQERPEDAVELLQRAVVLEPDDSEARLELAIALLAASRPTDARVELERVVESQPENGRAQLYLGIAYYRERRFEDANAALQRAEELDSSLELEARYYAGLTAAFLGNLEASSASFTAAAINSPSHPLGRSASELREQLAREAPRTWSLAATAGMEFDSNPLLTPDDPDPDTDLDDPDPDGRGVFRVGGWWQAWQGRRTGIRVGYDGYLALQITETQVDQQVHVGWLSGTWSIGPVQLGARYSFSEMLQDPLQEFVRIHRAAPTVSLQTGEWGVSQVFYEFQDYRFPNEDLARSNPLEARLERDGQQHSVGLQQFAFPGEPVQFLRVGGFLTTFDTRGDEFDYDGFEVSAAGGLGLPFQVAGTASYQLQYRDYQNDSVFALPHRREREDLIHRATFDLARSLWKNVDASLSYALTVDDSNVNTFDFVSHIVGAYVHYRF